MDVLSPTLMRKIFISFLLASLTSLSVAQAVTFSDLGGIAPDLKDAVQKLTDQGIIKGYGDGTFRPNRDISEKEWALLVLRAVRESPDVGVYSDRPITRLEALKLLAREWRLLWQNESQAPIFKDLAIFQDNALVNYFFYSQIIKGRTTTEFGPGLTLTRAEAAKILLLAKEFWQPTKTSLPTPVPLPTGIPITQNVVEIIDVSPMTLSPGETGSLLFVIRNSDRLETGMMYNQNYFVSVLDGNVDIIGSTEIGNGLYQVVFKASPQSGPSNINIQILVLLGGSYRTDINEYLRHKQSAQVTTPQISLARLVPSNISSGNEAQIIVTPQNYNGSPVTGLEISAELTRGSGTITAQPIETPAGSGVYIGTYKAGSGHSGQEIEILVRIDNIASRPQTIIRGTIR